MRRRGIRPSKKLIALSTISYPFWFEVKCCGESHAVLYKPGYLLQFPHHPEANEIAIAKAMMALGADTPPCFRFMSAEKTETVFGVKYGLNKCSEILAYNGNGNFALQNAIHLYPEDVKDVS
jgi:hypothetical protein